MKRIFRAPFRLAIIHTGLIIIFMFTLSQRWFLGDIPFDCFYVPFLITSGPLVYFLAHMAQHRVEGLFTPEQVMIPWDIIPGTICLILGGLQWILLEGFGGALIRKWKKRSSNQASQTIGAEAAPLSER